MALTPDAFTIVHRNGSALPDLIYPWDGTLAACVAGCINVARGYLRHARVQAALVSFAKEFGRSVPNAWYRDPCHGYRSIEDVVNDFINIIVTDFPMVCVDDSITNPDCLGAHARREWDGRFQPRDQSILLNGPRVRDMVAAIMRARQSNDRTGDDHIQTRTFVFILANTLFHEMCHMLGTFLTKGRGSTPGHVRAEVGLYTKIDIGEAGRHLEEVIYGGTLEVYRDDTRDNSQAGIPCLLTKHGAGKISQETIDATLRHEYQFPYRLEGAFANPDYLATLGKHQPPDNLTDPMEWQTMQDFKRHRHGVPVGSEAALYRDLFNHGLKVERHEGIAGCRW